MSAIAEVISNHAITIEPNETLTRRVLALVHDNMIISTYPGHQSDAAIDLARVLCRALAQPIDIFRLHRSACEGLHAGAFADTKGPDWVHVAHVHSTFLSGVKIEVFDHDLRAAGVHQHSAP